MGPPRGDAVDHVGQADDCERVGEVQLSWAARARWPDPAGLWRGRRNRLARAGVDRAGSWRSVVPVTAPLVAALAPDRRSEGLQTPRRYRLLPGARCRRAGTPPSPRRAGSHDARGQSAARPPLLRALAPASSPPVLRLGQPDLDRASPAQPHRRARRRQRRERRTRHTRRSAMRHRRRAAAPVRRRSRVRSTPATSLRRSTPTARGRCRAEPAARLPPVARNSARIPRAEQRRPGTGAEDEQCRRSGETSVPVRPPSQLDDAESRYSTGCSEPHVVIASDSNQPVTRLGTSLSRGWAPVCHAVGRSGERALEGGSVCRCAVCREHYLDRQLEFRGTREHGRRSRDHVARRKQD